MDNGTWLEMMGFHPNRHLAKAQKHNARCFVADNRICCHEMLVDRTAEVQLRHPCSPTQVIAEIMTASWSKKKLIGLGSLKQYAVGNTLVNGIFQLL